MEAHVNKNQKILLGLFVGVILLAGSFSGGFLVGHFLPAATSFLPSRSNQPQNVQTLFQPFWEAWDVVHKQYVDQPVDDEKLMQGAIRGMMDALGDKQTFYMEPQLYQTETSSLQGQYEGIGAYVDTEGDYLMIVSPIQGSPADKAGLKPGDKVIAIDGVDMTGVAPEQARLKVLGPDGSKVTLTILRKGEPKPLKFDIVRAKIVIRSVEGKMLENNIAY